MVVIFKYDDTINATKVIFRGKQKGIIYDYKYITHRTSEGYVIKYDGFGISKELFENIKNKINKIIILYNNNGKTKMYVSEVSDWERYGKEDKLGNYETQIFLNINYFKEV